MLQQTEQWHQARLGKLTASRMGDATARTKTGWGASRESYMTELLIERDTGEPFPHYVNAAMQWGIDNEAAAIVAYEMKRNIDVVGTGFVDHPMIENTGASPDGLVGDDGLVEIKCPEIKQHMRTLLGEPIDGGYIKQMQWQMACTGRAWCDWVSYDPRYSLRRQIKIIRVSRNDDMIAKLEAQAIEFLAELDDKEAALRALYDERVAA